MKIVSPRFIATTYIFTILFIFSVLVTAAQPAWATSPGSSHGPAGTAGTAIQWQSWTNDLFEKAAKEKRLVVLDLEAVWCHWCHVMDESTYRNAAVVNLINSRYIPVRVDQDSRPDLSNKYEDYGWPATIVFDWHGKELAKRSGYIPPAEFKQLLESLAGNPQPEEGVGASRPISYSSANFLAANLVAELNKRYQNGYDNKNGSWSTFQKFLDWDSVELALMRAKEGNTRAAQMARQTLDGQLNLLDPIWGGVYQYSTHGDWKHPHFEKIMQMQAENLRIYALGYEFFHSLKYEAAAQSIYKYLTQFLRSPEGAFYTSQDADLVPGKHSDWYFKLNDSQRRKHGVPKIDKHIYARENGWAINGIVKYYMATGNAEALDTAIKAADWTAKNRAIEDGGFSHDEKDQAGPFLGDNLYMARAFLSLYEATADRRWLKRAIETANFIAKNFRSPTHAGFVTAATAANSPLQAEPLLSENIDAARFFNLLYRYSGNKEYKALAELSMRYLSTPAIATKRRVLVAGLLLADSELRNEPVHITVVGPKGDPVAKALFAESIKYPIPYKRVEWLDRNEGPLPNADVDYPQLKAAAVFGCASERCSAPIYKPEKVMTTIDSLTQGPSGTQRPSGD